MSLYLNFCSLSSTKPLLASVWTSNLRYKSQNHVFAMHIIALFFPIFFKLSRSSDVEKRVGEEEEEGQEAGAEGGVEVDEER